VKAFAIVFTLISVLFFWGTFHYLLVYTKAGVFPPKPLLKKRILVLAGAGGSFLFLAILAFYLT